ncbi:MAG: methylated-DNA--[protein]-cysteine S-methyltransferase [Xanthobacteraceae bacterium]
MTSLGFTLFDTAIGQCGIAWSGRGIVCVQLPEASESKTRARMQRRFPDTQELEPPADVKRAIGEIAALLGGERRDLSAIVLDMDGVAPFERRVYEAARTISAGAIMTYGEIAKRLGDPGAARAVGQALGRNPFAIVVPCHRVLGAGDKAGGFSANGGTRTKLRMLAIEGSPAAGTGDLFDNT